MKIKQLSELLSLDVRKICRQKFKRELDVRNISIVPLDGGDYHIVITFNNDTNANECLSFDFDCNGHLIKVIE